MLLPKSASLEIQQSEDGSAHLHRLSRALLKSHVPGTFAKAADAGTGRPSASRRQKTPGRLNGFQIAQ
ncbi:hypothetical protein, partial [Variovorax atrisoli]|uniref:hypothetical protein n=1 Tax=Variovorax atrisoli TaxID=3394203 RepID=UPI001980154B